MKKQTILIIISIIILAILAGGLWYFINQKNNNQKTTTNQTPIQKEEQTATTASPENVQTATSSEEIDTSNWKTYRNEEYGFEVKYPGEWNLFEDEESNETWRSHKKWDKYNSILKIIDITNTEDSVGPSCSSGGPGLPREGMSIRVVINKINEENKNFNQIKNNCRISSEISTKECKTRELIINNSNTLVIDDPYYLCGYPSAYIIKNNYVYNLETIWNNISEKRDYYQKLFYIFLENLKVEDLNHPK